ncbi:MAG: cytidine deaminase [Bacteroidales bacterium]|jgi:cytidine deaminase|nr:cytidine deaminase [Bacteroidales bacterium]
MIIRRLTIEFEEWENETTLPEMEAKLLQMARKATARAYAPYSGFKVGAAIMLENGEIIQGSNQENSSYPVGTCAERTALFYASSLFPGVKIKAIAISAETGEPIPPCGMCRQAMLEFETIQNQNIPVIMGGKTGKIWKTSSVGSLLPLQFDHNHLK